MAMAKLRASLSCWFLVIAATAAITGCGNADSEQIALSRTAQIDRSLSAAASYVIRQQSADGAWRPDIYGAFKDGASLTPLVLRALLSTPPSERRDAVCRLGTDYLAKMVQPDGSIDAGPRGFSYPVYTAANAVIVLSAPCNTQYRKTRDAWLAYLRARQLTEALGWQPSDKEYGGWGYSSGLPRKPRPGEAAPALTESNLSATVFALEALRAAGVSAEDPVLSKTLIFVQRCQNYNSDPKLRNPAFDDGGFFFIYDDSVRNKAGRAGEDGTGRPRFASYGSTTSDGLRALLACGLSATDDRVAAARTWTERHFSAVDHPGRYAKERLGDRPALYFYYSCSVAQVLRALDLHEVQTERAKVAWAEALADELLQRQKADGSWINPARAVREDEPVLATAFATIALAICLDRLDSK
jgi:squalene-hopene/tetraprenyl-beta-curcumene cyclase